MALLGQRIIKVGEVTFTVNPKSDVIHVKVGSQRATISRNELWGFVFAITGPEQQDKMLPVRKEEMMKFKKVHTVQLKNDMKAGESLQFSCVIDVPLRVIEGMRDIIAKEVLGAISILDELKAMDAKEGRP